MNASRIPRTIEFTGIENQFRSIEVLANGVTNSIARSYDSLGRSDGFTLGSDYAVDYAYDTAGRFSAVTSSVDSVSSVVDYSYIQGSDILSGWSSNAGTSHTRSFEQNRDLITTVSNVYDSTAISTFAYENDALGRRTKRIDSASITNEFGYNIRSEVIEALMGTENYSYRYDPIGNRLACTNSTMALSYDSNQLNQYTNIANGVTLTPEYDSDGNMTNYNGWAYQWNGENRLRIASDGSTSVTNKYDYMGRRISKSVDGVETTFLYDGWNLVQETTGTNVTQYVWGLDLSQSLQGAGGVGGLLCVIENGEEYYPCFDANGNITEYVDSTGTNVVAHYEYSAFGKITSQSGTKADGQGDWDYSGTDRIATNSTRYVQHSNEWVREAKSYVFAEDGSPTATLVSTRREWMPIELGSAAPSPYTGILTAKSSTTDIHTNTTYSYTYTDASSDKTVWLFELSGHDGLSVSNRFERDFANNTVKIYDGLGRAVEQRSLDALDRIDTIQNLEGQTSSYEWVASGRLASVTRYDGTTVSNQWNAAGCLAARFWPGGTNSYTYYSNGMLESAAQGDCVVSNQVDSGGLLLRQDVDMGAHDTAVEYDYNPAGLLTNTACSAGSFSSDVGSEYDAAVRVSALHTEAGDFAYSYDTRSGLPAAVSNSVSGVHADYQYDRLHNVTNIVWRKSDGTVLQSHALSYRNYDMVAEIKREDDSTRRFQYDGLDRLVSEQSGGTTNLYQYDLAGNRTNRTVNGTDTAYTLGSGNRLSSWGASGSMDYDTAGNATNIVYQDGRELAIEYDGLYRVTAVYTNGVIAEEYGYDASGRRAWIASGGTTNYMVYNGEDLVAEVDASGDPVRSYVHGPGIDNLLSMTVYGASETNTYYALTDHLGTVNALADETGAIVELYEYDAWGDITVYDENDTEIPQSQYGNRFTFQGREYSWATGLYNFRARWYDPKTGRWLSKDPIGIEGGLNQYVFCVNNAVNFIDPFGLRYLGRKRISDTIMGTEEGQNIANRLREITADSGNEWASWVGRKIDNSCEWGVSQPSEGDSLGSRPSLGVRPRDPWIPSGIIHTHPIESNPSPSDYRSDGTYNRYVLNLNPNASDFFVVTPGRIYQLKPGKGYYYLEPDK